MTTAKQIWNNFCDAQGIAASSVPLFASDRDGFVETKEIGKNAKPESAGSSSSNGRIDFERNRHFCWRLVSKKRVNMTV